MKRQILCTVKRELRYKSPLLVAFRRIPRRSQGLDQHPYHRSISFIDELVFARKLRLSRTLLSCLYQLMDRKAIHPFGCLPVRFTRFNGRRRDGDDGRLFDVGASVNSVSAFDGPDERAPAQTGGKKHEKHLLPACHGQNITSCGYATNRGQCLKGALHASSLCHTQLETGTRPKVYIRYTQAAYGYLLGKVRSGACCLISAYLNDLG